MTCGRTPREIATVSSMRVLSFLSGREGPAHGEAREPRGSRHTPSSSPSGRDAPTEKPRGSGSRGWSAAGPEELCSAATAASSSSEAAASASSGARHDELLHREVAVKRVDLAYDRQ